MYKPLLFKLTVLVLVVTLLSMGVTTFFVTLFAHDTLKDNIQTDLQSDARLIGLWLENRQAELSQEGIVELAATVNKRITIIDYAGNALVDSKVGLDKLGYLGDRPEVRAAQQGNVGFDERSSQVLNNSFIYVALPVESKIVRVSVESRLIDYYLDDLYEGTFLIALVIALLALGVAYIVNRNITDPLNDLLDVTNRLQNGQFGRRVLVRSQDEIGKLSRSFNDLSETLEIMFDTVNDRESKLNAVLSSMDDGVLAVDIQRKVILANRAIGELVDEKEDELIGKEQMEVIRSLELSNIITETMKSKDSVAKEINLYPSSERVFAVSSSPLESEENSIIGVVAVLREVTNLRKLEKMRQEFVANVSHELRTPLTSIKGFVETILNGEVDDPNLIKRFLKIVEDETDRMITLINDLLDLSRIESDQQRLKLEPVDIQQIFSDILLILQNKAESKNISLINNIEPNTLVLGDVKLLKQVAINLVDNSIKYNHEGGKVEIHGVKLEDHLKVIIEDTGLGIPNEQINRIFERFYRVDKGRSRSMGGTGLGLSIVRHIINKHQGEIHAESSPDNGTKMIFTLKLAK